ncbi:MAG: stage II sporulation protein M [Clostridia bacterium]|nr:stage II sporulation protein M [Clostridia bacterium]
MVSSILLQNILFIPCILALAVSGMKLYKAIMKDKRRETIKLEITRHTIFSCILLMGLELAALVEVYLSSNLLEICSKYF